MYVIVKTIMTDVDDNKETLEPLYVAGAGVDIKWCSHFGKQTRNS